jgi:pimeloyl-ACP methyl ester carboxylesterase
MTYHRTSAIDGLNIFYREVGPAGAPVLPLLHGFPTSSHMFRNLITALADRYHVIAPDYPGYGQSDRPDRIKFVYTFDRFAEDKGLPAPWARDARCPSPRHRGAPGRFGSVSLRPVAAAHSMAAAAQ